MCLVPTVAELGGALLDLGGLFVEVFSAEVDDLVLLGGDLSVLFNAFRDGDNLHIVK